MPAAAGTLAMSDPQSPVKTPVVRYQVLLVDDHPLVRDGLATVIQQEPDLCVCGQAEDSEQGYAEAALRKPDVVVVDLSLRGESGLDLIKRLQTLPHPPRVLVLSMHDESFYAERALRAGAMGYVMKRETSGNVVKAIRQIILGRVFVSDAIASQMAEKFVGLRSQKGLSSVERLSDRELEVFRRMGRGQESRRIAEELHLSLKTIHTHCAHIKEKLGLENITELMREAVRWVEHENRS